MRRRREFKRTIPPGQRGTGELLASIRDRLTDTRGVAEVDELQRRFRDLLAANAAGDLSAADVVACLYGMGLDKERSTDAA